MARHSFGTLMMVNGSWLTGSCPGCWKSVADVCRIIVTRVGSPMSNWVERCCIKRRTLKNYWKVTITEFTLNLGERQPSGITKGLQGTGRNVKAQADILTVQSLTNPFIRIFLIQPVYSGFRYPFINIFSSPDNCWLSMTIPAISPVQFVNEGESRFFGNQGYFPLYYRMLHNSWENRSLNS